MNSNIKFNKNKMELKMKVPKHSFREINYVFQLIQEFRIKSETVMSRTSGKIAIVVMYILSEGYFLFYLNV